MAPLRAMNCFNSLSRVSPRNWSSCRSMPFLEQPNLKLYFEEQGSGIPFFFQHGLGGDISQPFSLFHPPPGIRLIAFDCRGHGRSSVGPLDQLLLSTFADDLLALMNYLEIPSAIVGGISM